MTPLCRVVQNSSCKKEPQYDECRGRIYYVPWHVRRHSRQLCSYLFCKNLQIFQTLSFAMTRTMSCGGGRLSFRRAHRRASISQRSSLDYLIKTISSTTAAFEAVWQAAEIFHGYFCRVDQITSTAATNVPFEYDVYSG